MIEDLKEGDKFVQRSGGGTNEAYHQRAGEGIGGCEFRSSWSVNLRPTIMIALSLFRAWNKYTSSSVLL